MSVKVGADELCHLERKSCPKREHSMPEYCSFSLGATSGNSLFLALLLRVGEGNSHTRRGSHQTYFAVSLLSLENALDNNFTYLFVSHKLSLVRHKKSLQ